MRNSSTQFFKSTVIGGLFFIIPIALIVIVLAKCLAVARPIAVLLAEKLPFEKIGGVAISFLLEIGLVILVCFFGGLFYKTRPAKHFVAWLESNILSNIPSYSFMKSMGESVLGMDESKTQEVVLAWIEESWQLAFVTDRLANGMIAVYVPGAPSPWSGSLYFMTVEKIRKVDITVKYALAIIKRIGVGTDEILKGKIAETNK